MPGLDEILGADLAGNATWQSLAYLFGCVASGLVLSFIINGVLRRVAKAFGEGTAKHALIDAIYRPLRWALVVAGFWVGIILFQEDIGVEFDASQWRWLLTTELPFVLWFALRLTDNMAALWMQRAAKTEGTYDDQLVPIVRVSVKGTLVIVGIIMIVQNAGGDVASLLAGFGIGGVAIAMASKDTIANLFGSLVIFVDRPFQIGDWVEIGGQEGTVEEVGLRTTRIRTFANSLITVPNSALTTSAINNWSKMQKRRIKVTLGITYDCDADKVQSAVDAIRDVLKTDERICQDFMLVNFTEFGASSLDIFVYCFTVTTRWDEYMQVRQEVFLEFMRRLQNLGVGLAFPTQSLHIESLPKGLTAGALPR